MSQSDMKLRRVASQSGVVLYAMAMTTLSLAWQTLIQAMDRPPGAMRAFAVSGSLLMLVGLPAFCFLTGRALRNAAAEAGRA